MEFPIQSDDELIEHNTKTRRTGVIVRTIRIIRDNFDIFLFLLCVFLLAGAAWFAARFYLGLTANQIKTEISELIYCLVLVCAGIATGVGKLFAKQGTISKTLSGRIDNNHTVTGQSMPPRNN